MFTQCPDCRTIFELGIDDLKAAEGHVCCGECDKVFNALASLTDLPPGAQEELQGMAESAAEAAALNEVAAEMASGDLFEDVLDEEDESDSSRWAPDDQGIAQGEIDSLERERWEQKLAELGLDETEVNEADKGAENLPDAEPPDSAADSPSVAESLTEVNEEDELPNEADWLLTERTPRADWHWVVAATVAGLAMLAQSVHFWRTDLADVPAMEQWLRPFYASLGAPLPQDWDISAYGLAKDTISDHPEVPGALLVNATLVNNAKRAQPYPLLKITLLDRWGEPIGERFFAPVEYLPDTQAAAQPIEPGQVSQASVLIMDPGAGAVSYGIDACLRNAKNRLVCAHGRDY